jgi:peptidylprolyl isomerase
MFLLVFSACGITSKIAQPPVFLQHESGIEYLIVKKGNGDKPLINDMVKVHYTLMLEDSTLIDSSYDRGEPVSFKLGAGHVIKGWDIGMAFLAEGDDAILRIPPHLAYGDKPMGNIPSNSMLIFNVRIVDIMPAPKPFDVDEKTVFTETSSGLKYTIVEKGRGTKLEPGMRVRIHYNGYFEDFTMFDSSLERENPIDITLGRGMVIRGWDEGLTYLRVGDKARLWIPYNLAYGEQGRGPIAPRSNLIFDVQVIDAEEPVKAIPYIVTGRDTLITESGLQYLIVEQGSGDSPEIGSIVNVNYSGYLLDGELFDSSVERGQPFRFVLGQGQVIRGWDEGVALMRKGAKYRFIIPSGLAYGDRGVGPIPSGSSLVFDVELIDFE